MMRKIAVIVCVSLAMAGCQGTTDMERIGQLFRMGFQSIGGAAEVPRETVVPVPYATLGVQLGSSDQAMFVMQSKSGSDLQWVDKTQYAITTRDGRILRTAGFKYNLKGIQIDPNPNGGANRDYRYDLADMNAYGVIVHCVLRDGGAEQITILGDAHRTRHILEDCAASELDWSFTNEYWVNPDSGFVWRSVQNVHPELDPITLVTFRPAA